MSITGKNNIDVIIKGCIKGNSKSREALYKMYADKMYAVCRYYTKDYTEAEDVLHEGFIKIFENVSKFKNKGSFEGWIRRIIVNTALEKFRRNNKMHSVPEDFLTIEDNKSVDVESAISAKELSQMISELTPKYKMVFNLYALEGYSHKEISEMLGISEGTSKSNLARARNILKKRVEESYKINKVI
ncbi:MAG: RNA polymerase sigma factor [Bacteroidota bacterium]|nr:RNA polymerase sigma factor [Bacteroidota bacterium]